MTENKNVWIEFYLQGGHHIEGWITEKQLGFVMEMLAIHGGGIVHINDKIVDNRYETVIVIDQIAAVSYSSRKIEE